jgi:hypothetical protein
MNYEDTRYELDELDKFENEYYRNELEKMPEIEFRRMKGGKHYGRI